MGLTDAKLAAIEGFGHSGVEVGFEEIINDLDALGTYLKESKTTLTNFENRINELAPANARDQQGTLGVIKEILENKESYKGKNLNFEKFVKNADGNPAYIDIYTNTIPPKMVERKWLTVGGVSQTDFVREFIKRDLFNASDINQIVWSIKGNKLTKAQVVGFLNSPEAVIELNKINLSKLRSMLENELIIEGNKAQSVADFFNELENFNKVFK